MKHLTILSLLALAGCFTTTVQPVAAWKFDYRRTAEAAAEPAFGIARISQVGVRAPYDVLPIAVLRANGSLAFDPFNSYAAIPSMLLKGVVYDALQQSGSFEAVISPSSIVRNSVSIEIVFSNLYLDCREEDSRSAFASLELRLVGADRSIVKVAKGEGRADAAKGDYSAAFSAALSKALEDSLSKLR